MTHRTKGNVAKRKLEHVGQNDIVETVGHVEQAEQIEQEKSNKMNT